MIQTKIIELILLPTLLSSLLLTNKPTLQANRLSRGYPQTCINLYYDDGIGELFARCRTIDGEYEESSIDLNKYIANEDGNLVWNKGGNYIESVDKCNITSNTNKQSRLTYLKCIEVSSVDGGEKLHIILLDEHIENENGQLKYY